MNTQLSIDLSSPIPPFEQIRSQLASMISIGALSPGARLSPVRALAADLGVATGTVARAYKELEAAGLVESRRRSGTVVRASSSNSTSSAAAQREVSEAIEELLLSSRRAGFGSETILALLRARLQQEKWQ
ncbi:GntR family transcriptional regulator [Psychromicrobium lacuslunae]|uniref:GntR family transcriptional regulator n=1 Tax=Psychromicrobium lacuslunae TaxID=1618207 RepID=A0A0D4BZN3_9MICC|nr:GntR family transcriptional regulator [Psychromicrobium lacuslunae]AJT41774.1 GntR family transcriptional regulator [Psychromicrobium lacuslunae]